MAGPTGYPLIGNLLDFERDRPAFLLNCYRRFGETTHLRIIVPTLLINNPDDIHHVLVAHEERYRKSFRTISRLARGMFARGLLTRRGAAHKRHRRMVQPAFHRQAVAAFAQTIQGFLDEMLERWVTATEVEITAELDRFAERALFRTLLGKLDAESEQRLSEINHIRRDFIGRAFRRQFPFPQLLPTWRNWKYQQAVRSQKRIFQELVARAYKGELEPDSLLAQLAMPENAQGQRLNEDELFDEIWELLTAGFETSREGLTWSSYLLAKHPECAARLREEVERVAGQETIAVNHLQQLVYTDMFFSEAMRLFPPVWMFVRVANEDDVLPSGARVTAGSRIYLCQYTAHRNERFFPDAERFDPNRFHPDIRHKRPRFSYFPFGGGERVCIGEPLARLGGVLLLASVARRFELQLCAGQRIEPVGAITLRPKNPIRILVRQI